MMQLEAENGTLENVEIAAGAITILQAVLDNILGGVQHASFLRAAS